MSTTRERRSAKWRATRVCARERRQWKAAYQIPDALKHRQQEIIAFRDYLSGTMYAHPTYEVASPHHFRGILYATIAHGEETYQIEATCETVRVHTRGYGRLSGGCLEHVLPQAEIHGFTFDFSMVRADEPSRGTRHRQRVDFDRWKASIKRRRAEEATLAMVRR